MNQVIKKIKYYKRMIENKLSEIMGRKRVKIAELARAINISFAAAHRLYHNKVKTIDLNILDSLCKYLECTPNDIFKFTPD